MHGMARRTSAGVEARAGFTRPQGAGQDEEKETSALPCDRPASQPGGFPDKRAGSFHGQLTYWPLTAAPCWARNVM